MNTATKQNNIKHIPTELNYFYHTHKMIRRLKQQGNTSRLIILGLLIYNTILTVKIYPLFMFYMTMFD